MKIRIDFFADSGFVSYSIWENSSDVVASAVLSTLFRPSGLTETLG